MTSTETLCRDEFSRSDDNEESEINILNENEDDEMEVYGYTRNVLATSITWILIILSLGLLRLIFHWCPQWMLYMTHRRCPLKYAKKVLIVDNNRGLNKRYITENVRTTSLDDLSLQDVKSKHKELRVQDLSDLLRPKNHSVRIYLNDGSYIDSSRFRIIEAKKLFYVWREESKMFVKISGMEKAVNKADFHAVRGYSANEQFIRRLIYGDNVIDIKPESITSLICSELLTPFYIFQICTIIIWFLEPYICYASAIIAMSTFGIGSSVFQSRQNQKKLQKTVHSVSKVLVCRDLGRTRNDAQYEEIFTNCLVPGDVIVIPREGCSIMPCDAVLISGNCIVNESMLTGESVPITKTAIPCHNNLVYSEKDDINHTLFGGTHILQARYYAEEYVHAVVIRTAFLTAKGALVRSILYPVQHDFKFDRDIQKVVWFLSVIAALGTAYSYVLKTLEHEDMYTRIIDSLDVITIIVPPALPAAMTVGKYYAVKRLQEKYISCINASVVTVAGSINCVCFDKTGTLTEEGLDLYGVIPSIKAELQTVVLDVKHSQANELKRAMACCHSLTIINQEICGDPLDVKMFESTNWILEEPEVTDSIKYDLLAPTVVKAPFDQLEPEIGLIHQFQFSSHLQRMSVITRHINSKNFTVYCKGSPEMIKSLCVPQTIPNNMESTLHKYAMKGFRIIAMAYKTIPLIDIYKLKRLHREEAENNLTFVGLILFENKLKSKTISIINELQQAKMKIFMLTGDNVQTAICVARECNMIGSTDTVVHVNVIKTNELSPPIICCSIAQDDFSTTVTMQKIPTEKVMFTIDTPLNYTNKLVLTGNTWQILKDYYPALIPKIISKSVIFARMSPDQKQQVIEELISVGYYVAMCGDGANDCGALRTAHVGISLSETESSIASAFTSSKPDISCVPQVIREGRAALVTSFGLFKFMVLYSVLEFFSTLLLYTIGSTLSDFEFLYIDLCLIVVFGFFFGQTRPYEGPLVAAPPLSSLISTIPMVSMMLQTVIMLSFQVTVFLVVRHFPWYQPLYIVDKIDKLANYENYVIYTISQFQYIILAICYSFGAPYREAIYKNIYFFASIVALTAISAVITVSRLPFIETVMRFKYPPNVDMAVVIFCMAIVNFVISFITEDFIVNWLLYNLAYSGRNNANSSSSSSKGRQAIDHGGTLKKCRSLIGDCSNGGSWQADRLSVEHLSEVQVKSYGTMNELHVI